MSDDKNSCLRQLLARPGIIRSFAPHDVFTAMAFEQAGIEMLFLGGFGAAASSLGLPDMGIITLTEMADAIRRMTARLNIPLIADGDTGHGEIPNVIRTVREFEAAGASGMLLEDQVFPKRCGHFEGKQVVPQTEMLAKLHAALDARSDQNFVIIARTDARAIEGYSAAVDRANAYGEAGADVCFIEAPQSTDELQRLPSDVPYPQLANMLIGGKTPIHGADELAKFGFKIAVDPVGSLQITAKAIQRLAHAMKSEGRIDGLAEEMLSFDELKQLLRVNDFETPQNA